jgi:hypothetical protein
VSFPDGYVDGTDAGAGDGRHSAVAPTVPTREYRHADIGTGPR